MTSLSPERRATVYVVDDDDAIQNSLTSLLTIWGLQVDAFSSGKSCLDSYCDDWTGCLIVDHRMPEMSGIELLKRLRDRSCTLPVILMTGHACAELRRQAVNFGTVELLEKPFDVDRLKGFLTCLMPEELRDSG